MFRRVVRSLITAFAFLSLRRRRGLQELRPDVKPIRNRPAASQNGELDDLNLFWRLL